MKLLVIIVAFVTSSIAQANDINCLAKNIYYEARGEPFVGQLAVAKVTLNRVKSRQYPNSVCKVVYQPKQFEWTRKKYALTAPDESWDNILILAETLLKPNVKFLTGFKATHFHAEYVSPDWWDLEPYAKIGKHIFYTNKLAFDWR